MSANDEQSVILIVIGFHSERELDRFLRTEIRYLKGFDMVAHRCAELRLKFEIAAYRGMARLVGELSAENPSLEFHALSADGLSTRYDLVRAGLSVQSEECPSGTSPLKEFALRLFDHARTCPSIEILYQTYQ